MNILKIQMEKNKDYKPDLKEVLDSLESRGRRIDFLNKELDLTKKELANVRKQVINKEETIQWLFGRLREYEKKNKSYKT